MTEGQAVSSSRPHPKPRHPLPDVMIDEWSPRNGDLKPSDVTQGSERAVWWRCASGHEWNTSPNFRIHVNADSLDVHGCPICTGRRVETGVNDLATTHPSLAAEWVSCQVDGSSPKSVSAGSTVRVLWSCRVCAYRWEAEVNSRALAGTGCSSCRGTAMLPGVTSLDTVPEVVALWHPTKNLPVAPSKVHRGSNKVFWWRCAAGHEWQAPAARLVEAHKHARSETFGCAICVRTGMHDEPRELLSEALPDLAAQWHPTLNGDATPDTVSIGSDRKVWWRCPAHGHEWQAPIKRRARGGGCPYCSGRQVLPGFNDLATVYPNTASQWHPTLNGDLTPADITASSSKKVYWLCHRGHVSYGSPYTKNTRKQDGPIACSECVRERRREAKAVLVEGVSESRRRDVL